MQTSEPSSHSGGVAIAIITYAAPTGMLESAVESVLANVGDLGRPTSIEVIDNGATARSRLVGFGDRITVTEAGSNDGFAAAVNLGFAHGRASGAEFLVCLNDDVVVSEGWLQPLIAALEARPELGGVQPLLLNASDGTIDSAGVELDRFGAGADRLRGQPADRATASDVVAITGGAAMFRSALVSSIGYLDERFFLYYEDVDWCLRAAAAGWKFAVVPSSKVLHRGSATTVGLGDELTVVQERNRLWNTATHGSARQIAGALSLSARRLRHPPRSAHLKALGRGVTGMVPRLGRRFVGSTVGRSRHGRSGGGG